MTTFNVYRRETVNDIPVAIATGLTSKNYSDTTAISGATYLYSVGAVKDGVEKFSSEIIVTSGDPFYQNVNFLLIAKENESILDKSPNPKVISNSGVMVTSIAQPDITSAIMVFNGNSSLAANMDSISNDFTIEIIMKPKRIETDYNRIFAFGATESNGNLVLLFEPGTSKIYASTYNNGWTNISSNKATVQVGTRYHVCIQKVGNNYQVFLDGVLVGQQTISSFNISNSLTLGGSQDGSNRSQFDCYKFRITNVARYPTTGFTPPTDFPTS